MFTDLREWLGHLSSAEFREVRGAHWDLEIGAATELAAEQPGGGPALLFDEIEGYPAGFRVLANPLGSLVRLALTLGLPTSSHDSKKESLFAWINKSRNLHPCPPKEVTSGEAAVMENTLTGEDVNVLRFPAPKWHALDGGRYIGTAALVITRHPQTGEVNAGCYRTSVLDRNHLLVAISPGKHGRLHRDLTLRKQNYCPVAFSFGHDPLLFLASCMDINHADHGSEYEWYGAVHGTPLKTVQTRLYGLPVPAASEIVMEGKWVPDWIAPEGPFGEWTGYYAHSQRPVPVVEVEAIYHRNNPILLGHPPGKARGATAGFRSITRSALIYESLIRAGVPGITGVWCHEPGGGRMFVAVGLEQQYAGHVTQAGALAAQAAEGAYLGRYTIVVDNDIDFTDLADVVWAMCTRSDPERSIQVLKRCWSGPLDPAIPSALKGFNSRAIIDACKPYEWLAEFPRTVTTDPDLKNAVARKWPGLKSRSSD